MATSLRFDVIVLAGPRVEVWPSIGVRTLSLFLTKMGLSVGQFGGDTTVRGVVPFAGTGGIAMIEDSQHRLHRAQGRAVVRVVPESFLPPPFSGWYSSGLIPLSTAQRLISEAEVTWDPAAAILGTGNAALSFGTVLLQKGVDEVYCIETSSQWGAKRFAGWEVQRRQFEMAGGKIIEATPIELVHQGALSWLLRLKDAQGVRILEVGRVVSAGPFEQRPGIKEYPPESCLFEFEQTATGQYTSNVEGWTLEEERGLWLATRIARSLSQDLRPHREELTQAFRRTRARLKRFGEHYNKPHTPMYEGKWLKVEETRRIKAFPGVPTKAHARGPIASVECFEEISCRICQDICPTSAIDFGSGLPALVEDKCISCGLCVKACPTGSIPMIQEAENLSTLALPIKGSALKLGPVQLVNRRGDSLGSGKIVAVDPEASPEGTRLIKVEVPSHLVWDARSVRKGKGAALASRGQLEDEAYLAAVDRSATRTKKVELLLNGEKRWVRDQVLISIALFEIGQNRPEDALLCGDGSCGKCVLSVDGSPKLACQNKVHQGMSIRTDFPSVTPKKDCSSSLCPCIGVSQDEVVERLKQGRLHSPEAILSVTHVGEGVCHGQLCGPALIRVLVNEGLPVSQWIDWRFPWSDWTVKSN